MSQPTKSSLNAAQARLVELLQAVNFGRLEDLRVSRGQPIFDPPPRVVQKWKIGGENGPRVDSGHSDFRLKHEIVELLELVGGIGEGVIRSVEIRFGLPCTVEFEWHHYSGVVPTAIKLYPRQDER